MGKPPWGLRNVNVHIHASQVSSWAAACKAQQLSPLQRPSLVFLSRLPAAGACGPTRNQSASAGSTKFLHTCPFPGHGPVESPFEIPKVLSKICFGEASSDERHEGRREACGAPTASHASNAAKMGKKTVDPNWQKSCLHTSAHIKQDPGPEETRAIRSHLGPCSAGCGAPSCPIACAYAVRRPAHKVSRFHTNTAQHTPSRRHITTTGSQGRASPPPPFTAAPRPLGR